MDESNGNGVPGGIGDVDIVQNGNGNEALVVLTGDRGSNADIDQADDNNTVIANILSSQFKLTVSQGGGAPGGDNNSAIFDIDNGNAATINVTQNDNDNEATVSLLNDFGSTVNITQTNAGIGHLAMVNLSDAQNGMFNIVQSAGNSNSATITADDVQGVTGTINHITSTDSIVTVTFVDGDDFQTVAANQTNCFGCVATVSYTHLTLPTIYSV